MIRRLAAVAFTAIAVVACSDDDDEAAEDAPTSTETTAEGPDTRLVINPHDDGTSAAARKEAVLLAEECVVFESDGEKSVAVWPRGTTLVADGVRLGDQVLRFGERLVLGGGEANTPEHLADLGANDCGLSTAWIVGSARPFE